MHANALEILKNFDALSDDSIASPKVAAIVLGVCERTLRRHSQLRRVQLSPRRIGYRVGEIRNFIRDAKAG